MTNKPQITEITDEQRAQFPAYVEKWIVAGRNTKPIDFEKARKVVLDVYQLIRDRGEYQGEPPNPPPHRIWKCASPNLANQAGMRLSGVSDGFWATQPFGSSVARFQVVADVLGARKYFDPMVIRALDLLEPLCMETGAVYWGHDFAIIVDRPSILKLTQVGNAHVLHCADGPAIAWGRGPDGEYSPDDPEGYAMFYWQGTEVPRAWVMEKPQTAEERRTRAAEVLQSSNAEVMRSGAEILGWDVILDALGKRIIDKHSDPKFGMLVEVDLPVPGGQTTTPGRFVIAECGTGRTIAFPVDPNAQTAIEAGARSYNVPVALYEKMTVRT